MNWRRHFRSVRRRGTRHWVFAGTDRTFTLAKKYKIKTAFGTDILFSARLAQRQGELLSKLVRWYTPAETADHGDRDECPTAGAVRQAQSVSRQARGG